MTKLRMSGAEWDDKTADSIQPQTVGAVDLKPRMEEQDSIGESGHDIRLSDLRMRHIQYEGGTADEMRNIFFVLTGIIFVLGVAVVSTDNPAEFLSRFLSAGEEIINTTVHLLSSVF